MHSVTIQLRPSELLGATFRLMRRLRIFKLLLLATLLAAAWQARDSFSNQIVLAIVAVPLTALLFTAAAVVLAFLVQAAIVSVRLCRDPSVLGPREYTIAPEGLRIRAGAQAQVVPRGQVSKLIRTRRTQLVGLSGRALHILPRRCFASAQLTMSFGMPCNRWP
jgi:hypothetical protein